MRLSRTTIPLALILGALLALLVACTSSTTSSISGSKPSTSAKAAPTSSSKSASAASTGKEPPISSGDWRLDSVTLSNQLGEFGGRARITYTGSDQNGGNQTFTITVFKNGHDIASLDGAANSVPPNTTVTVDLISTDSYTSGPYTYDFQKNL